MNKAHLGRDGALRRPRPSEVEDANDRYQDVRFGARFRRPCASLGDGDAAAQRPYQAEASHE